MRPTSSEHARTIVWLIDGNDGYGVRSAVSTLIDGVRDRGWRTAVVSLNDGPFLQECQERGLETRCLNVAPAPAFPGGVIRKAVGWIQNLRYSQKMRGPLARTIGELRADAVHLLRPNLVSVGGAAAQSLGIACFWELPNIVSPGFLGINRRLYQSICARYGIIALANSRHTADTLGRRPIEAEVLYLGVDTKRFDPDAVQAVPRNRMGIPEGAVVVGIVARLTPSKGQDRVLRALASLGRCSSEVHLLLLGGPVDGPFAAQLRDIASMQAPPIQLHLIDQVPDPERYYPLMDVVVNSRVDPEPFGLSVIEAMMMGKPLLVHALGGPAETVIDGVTGWHVKDPSVESYAVALRRVLDQRALWPQMGQAARDRALAHFSADSQTRRYMAIVDRALNSRE